MQLFRRKVTTRQTPYGRPHKGPLEDPELESFLAADTDSNAATAEKLKKKVSKVLKRLWGSGNTKQEDHELQLDKENQPPFTNNNSSEEGKPLNQDQARKQSKKQGSKALQKLNLTISSHTAAQSQGMTGKKAYKPAGHQSRSTATYRVVGESTMMNRPYLVNSGMAMSRAASLSSKKKTPLGDTPSMNPVSSASKRAKKHVVQTIDASTTIGQSSKMIQTVNGHTEVLPLHVSGSGSIGLYHCMPEALATQRQNQSSRILSASETFDAAMEPRNQTQDCKRPRSPTSESEEACNLERPDDQDKHKNKMRPIASGSIAKVSIGTVEKNGIVITDTLDIARTASMPKPPTPVPKETNTHPDNRASSDLQKATMKAGAILSGSSNKGSHLYGGDLPSRPAIPTAPPASICLNSGTPSLHTAPLQKPFGTAAQPVVPLTAIAANICTALTKDSPAPSFVAQLQLSGSAATITTTPTTTTPTITVTTTPSSHTPPNSRPFATAATILEIPSPTARSMEFWGNYWNLHTPTPDKIPSPAERSLEFWAQFWRSPTTAATWSAVSSVNTATPTTTTSATTSSSSPAPFNIGGAYAAPQTPLAIPSPTARSLAFWAKFWGSPRTMAFDKIPSPEERSLEFWASFWSNSRTALAVASNPSTSPAISFSTSSGHLDGQSSIATFGATSSSVSSSSRPLQFGVPLHSGSSLAFYKFSFTFPPPFSSNNCNNGSGTSTNTSNINIITNNSLNLKAESTDMDLSN